MKAFFSIPFLSLILVFTLISSTQSSLSTKAGGIKFEKLGLESAKKQANKTGKLVFIDVYTSWCGPCKEMAKTTFQSKNVGKAFNKRCINIKIDAEKDVDGNLVSKQYGVNAYPTLLFLDPEGKLVKKVVGKQSEEKLLAILNSL